MSAPTIQSLSRGWVLGIARRQRSVRAEHDQAIAALDRRSQLIKESAEGIASVRSRDPGYQESFTRALDEQRAQLAESRVGIDEKFETQQSQLEREWAAVEAQQPGERLDAERAVLASERQAAEAARRAAEQDVAPCEEGSGLREYYERELLAAHQREAALAREAAELELRVDRSPTERAAAELELRAARDREAELARQATEQRLRADRRLDDLVDEVGEPKEPVGRKLSGESSHAAVVQSEEVVTEQGDLELDKKQSGTPWSAILAAGCAAVGVCALLFVPHSPASVVGNKNSKTEPGANDSDAKDAFAISGAHFWDVHESLGAGSPPSVGWAGGSSNGGVIAS